MAYICDKNGNRKCEVKKLSYNGVFMEVSSITVTIESPAPIDFAIGDYIDWDYDGLRYTLDAAAGVEKQARRNSIGDAFVYENLVFLSPLRAAENANFFDVILGNTNDFLTNTEFSFYGTAWDYAKRLEANLCRLNGAGSWKVRIWTGGTCYDETPATNLDTGSWENKLVDVSGIKCLAGFQQIYDLWGCAYVFSVVEGVNYVDFYDDFEQYAKAWSVGGEEKIFAYGKNNGLYKIRHTPDADHVLVTRLRPYGSGENLPTNYYLNSPDYHVDGNESSELAISRLMLPASEWTKDGVKHPSNAYLEQNTELYGDREGVVVWDGSDEELGEIKPTVRGLTIQDLLDLMAQGDSYRPVEAKWPDTSQRIDKIITGAAPVDNGAVAEAGYDFTVVESSGSFSEHAFGLTKINKEVEFNDIIMGVTPAISHLAEYRIVPTSVNKNVVSFDVTEAVSSIIAGVTAYINPYVNGIKVEDAMFPCEITEEVIHNTVGGVNYTKRFNISILDSVGNPIVFSTMLTGAVTFRIVAPIEFLPGRTPDRSLNVIRNEHNVSFNMLRGNKSIDKFFAVTIPEVGFDLSAAVSGSARLCMRSGANQPREFAIVPSSVKYLADTDTWYMRCKRSVDQSTSTYYPNSDAVISAGDEYYLAGIAMPALYVEIAAQKLLSAASAWLAIHSKPRMLSAVDVDNKIMAKEGIVLKEGMSLPISDIDLGINPENQESRVIDNIRIEEGTDAVRTFSVTLRDKKEKSSLNAAIRGATKDLATNASVNDAVSASVGTSHGSLSGRDLPNQHPITAITGLEEKLASILFFEKDGDGNIKLKDEYGGLWTHGFLTAGGRGSGGGGGGGIDLDRMWQSLTNAIADSHASDLIALAHIPDITTAKITDLAAWWSTQVATLGLGDAAFRGVASTIGQAITALVPGSLLYAILGDYFDASNTVKGFVNSSIATATATYRGAYNLVTDLSLPTSATEGQIAAALASAISGTDNNDYAFVQVPTSDATPTQIDHVDRYKFNGTAWSFEYTLNNSGFTAEQWAALNSGITDMLVTKLNGIAAGAQVNVLESVKVNGTAMAITGKAVNITDTDVLKGHSVDDFINAIQSLMSQVDSLATKTNYDYLNVTSLLADALSAQDAYVGKLTAIGAITGASFVKDGGTSAQFLKADGSIDSNAYALLSELTAVSGRVTTLEERINWDNYFGVDANGDVYVKMNGSTPRNFYSYGGVTAGGQGTGGGGGGGIDLDRMWASLTNTIVDAHASDLINIAHIPNITTGKITDLETWIANKGFVTKAVNDLTYYYTKTEVNGLIAAIDQFRYEIAASTSAVINPQPNVLYLIGPTGSGSDKYEEYVYPDSTTGWVKIGDTTIDLSGYVNSVVASGSGNYVSGFTKSGNTLTLAMGTLPTALKNPYALTFGNKTYDGSDAKEVTAADLMDGHSAADFVEAIQSLMSQLDSVASRTSFDFLNVTSFLADTLSAQDAYFGNLSAEGAAAIGGAVSLGSTLGVAGNTTLSGALQVGTSSSNKATTLYGTLSATGAVTIGSTLQVSDLLTAVAGLKLTNTQKIWFGDTYYIELVNIGTQAEPVYALHTNIGIVSDSFITAGAANPTLN